MSKTVANILIATDIPESISTLEGMLANESDLQVVGYGATAEEIVPLARELQPDVVVMDYDMPGLDGAEATRAILREDDGVLVIMLSVVNDVGDIRRAMRAGARDYLVKPLEDQELVQTIRWLLQERREYARMHAFVAQLRKAYEALFMDDKPVPPRVIAFLEAQVAEKPGDHLTLETLAVAYARNRNWAKLAPLIPALTGMQGESELQAT